MQMEKYSEMISPDGMILPGVRELTLEYLLNDEDFMTGNTDQQTHSEKRKELLMRSVDLYGNDTLFFDWMQENKIHEAGDTLFLKAIKASRLKGLCNINPDNGVIFFVTPQKENFYKDVEHIMNICVGLSYAAAIDIRKAQDIHAIIFNQDHLVFKITPNSGFNKYYPKELRDVVKIWDKIAEDIS